MEQEITHDLAEGTFLEKWPVWLRWSLFLPAAVIVPFVFLVIQYFTQTWFLGLGPNAFWLVLMRAVVYGGGFVGVGAIVAPKYQKIVALLLMIVVAMYAGIGIFSAFIVNVSLTSVVEVIITLIAAGYTTYYVFEWDKTGNL